jgi:tRNA(Ile)-lysidine synthase
LQSWHLSSDSPLAHAKGAHCTFSAIAKQGKGEKRRCCHSFCETKNFGKRMSFFKTISIVRKVHKDIAKRRLFRNDDKILIALSGGQDSMSCLFLTFLIKKQFKVHIAFSNCNHLFQTDSFYCYENNINQAYAVENSFSFSLCPYWLSNEKEARYWRYSILEKIACFYGFFSICFGHTETDRLETLILQLVRGSGKDGVLSIQWKKKQIFTASSLQSKTISYVRPLLGITRMETFLICKNWNIAFYSDRSNEFSFYKRNFLRKQILSLLKKNLNPRIERTVCKFTEILGEEESFLTDINKSLIWSSILQSKHITPLHFFQNISHEGNKKKIAKFLKKAPLAIKRRFLKNLLKRFYFKAINFEKIQTLGDFFFQKKRESNLTGYWNSVVFFIPVCNYILISRLCIFDGILKRKKRRNEFLIERSDRYISGNTLVTKIATQTLFVIHTNFYQEKQLKISFRQYSQVAIQFFLANRIPQFTSTNTNSSFSLNFTDFFNKKNICKNNRKKKESFLQNLLKCSKQKTFIFSNEWNQKSKEEFYCLINSVKNTKEFFSSVYFIFVPGIGVSIFKRKKPFV